MEEWTDSEEKTIEPQIPITVCAGEFMGMWDLA